MTKTHKIKHSDGKQATRKVTKSTKAKKTKKNKKHESNTVEQLHIQQTDDIMEDSRLEEVTELAS